MLRPSILAANFPYNAIVTSDPSIGRRTERRLRGVVTLELRGFFGERNRAMGILSSP